MQKSIFSKIYEDTVNDSSYDDFISKFKLDEQLNTLLKEQKHSNSYNSDNKKEILSNLNIVEEQKNNINHYINVNLCFEDEDLKNILNEFNSLLTNNIIFTDPKKPPSIDDLFPHLKKLENVNLSTSNKIIQTSILEFINNYEYQNYKNNNLYDKSNIFLLSNYYHSSNFKYEIYIKKNLTSISDRIEKEIITCIKVRNKIIYIGSKDGSIKSFSDKGYKNKTYIHEYDKKYKFVDKHVMCISFFDDDKYIIVGYASSFIILWEKETGNKIKIISSTHDLPVIACKILKYNQKELVVLSSDYEGKVKISYFSNGLIFSKENIITICDNIYLSFILETLDFSKEEEKNYESNLIYDKEKYSFYIVIIGNIKQIEIKKINKKTFSQKTLLLINNPDYKILQSNTDDLLENNIDIELLENPDISIGCGYLPDIHEDGDFNNHILLAVAWKDDISIYSMSDNKNLINPEKVGIYKNDNIINRVGFIANSILFFIDREKNIKFINTRQFNVEMEITNVDYVYRNIVTPSYSEICEIDDELYINKDKLFEGNSLNFNPIIYQQNNIYILIINKKKNNLTFSEELSINISNKQFENDKNNKDLNIGIIKIKLFSWKEAFDYYTNSGKWMKFFCVFKEILNQKIYTYSNLPYNYLQKTKLLIDNGKICGNYIYKYMIEKLKEEEENKQNDECEITTSIENNEINEKNNNNFMTIIIEFCISLHTINYLYDIIKDIDSNKNKGLINLFIQNLGAFIIKNKLRMEILSQDLLNEIIDFYFEKDGEKYITLYNFSHMIYHLNIDCLKNNEKIKEICNKYHFFNSIIYIYNCGLENFIYPLEQLFKYFLIAKELKIKDTIPSNKNFYSNLINEYEKESFELSKEYIGHKLLWYVDLCLEGRLYPTYEKIPPEQYSLMIPQIFKYLIKQDVINELIKFDSYTFFEVFTKFFTYEKNFNLITSIPKNEINEIINKYNNISIIKENFQSYFELNQLIYKIYGICDLIDNKLIKFDEYLFFIRISKIININIDLLFNSLNFILCFNIEMKNFQDKFNCHTQLLYKDDEYLLNLGNELIDFINYLIEKLNFEEKNVYKYLSILNTSTLKSHFLPIKIHLLKLNNDYKSCLDVYINLHSIYKNNVFEFINTNLTYLYKQSFELYIQFKNCVKEKLSDLCEISVKEIHNLINKWFYNELEDILNYLVKVPNIQLFYLEIILKKYKEDESEINDNIFIKDKYRDLLNLYLKLLIKFDRRQVLNALKNNSRYIDIKLCLKLCLENQLINSSIYLYQLLGEDINALNIIINQVDYCYQKIKRNKGTDNNLHHFLLGELKKNILNATEICENSNYYHPNNKEEINDDMNKKNNNIIMRKITDESIIDSDEDEDKKDDSNESYECWLLFLNKLYSLFQDIKSKKQNEYYKSLNEFFSNEIESYLKKMCFYVDIKTILDKITSNYQEAEFKELKGILTRIFSVNARLSEFYESFLYLIGHNIYIQQKKFSIIKNKATIINNYICDKCHIEFNENDKDSIIVFNCGHVFHFKCLPLVKEQTCIICRKEDIELNIIKEKDNNKLTNEEINEINEDFYKKHKEFENKSFLYKNIKNKIHKKRTMVKLDKLNEELFDF